MLAQLASSDQVIRENPASRGTETSAEVLVGPPSWVPGDGVKRRSTAVVLGNAHSGRRPRGTPPPGDGAVPVPFLTYLLYGKKKRKTCMAESVTA